MRSDPARVLREYVLEPLRAELRASGARVLVVRDSGASAQLRATSTRFDAAWVELERLAGADAAPLARDVVRVLCPRARIVCLVPGVPLTLSLVAAFRRDGAAELHERRTAAAAWRRVLDPHVEWRRWRALGVFLPPDPEWPRRHPLTFALLAAAEHVLCARRPFRRLGAWSLLEGVLR